MSTISYFFRRLHLCISFAVLFGLVAGCRGTQVETVEVPPTSLSAVVAEPLPTEPRYTVAQVLATLTSQAPLPTMTSPATLTPQPSNTPIPTLAPTETPLPTATATSPPTLAALTPTETATSIPIDTQPIEAQPVVLAPNGQPALTVQFSVNWTIDPNDTSQGIAEVLIVANGGDGEYEYRMDGKLLALPLFKYTRPLCSSQTSVLTITTGDGQSLSLDHVETPPCLD